MVFRTFRGIYSTTDACRSFFRDPQENLFQKLSATFTSRSEEFFCFASSGKIVNKQLKRNLEKFEGCDGFLFSLSDRKCSMSDRESM